mgnify:FL=1
MYTWYGMIRYIMPVREVQIVIEPRQMSYEEFPESTADTDGMRELITGRDDRYLVYRENIVYVQRDGMDLHLQLIIPAFVDDRKEKFPCIAYVQGSAWKKQNVYWSLPQLVKFAQRGYVVASIEYRSSGVAPFPAQVQDVKTALRFLRKNAREYGIDPWNFYLWGDSSGGHTALMAGITYGMPELDTDDYGEASLKINAVIDYYGPADIAKMNDALSTMDHTAPDSPEGLLIGGRNVLENREEAQKASPIPYITDDRAAPPVLILHGDKDRIVPFEQSLLLFDALKAHRKKAMFYKLRGADHGGPQFWTDQVLDIVERFIKTYYR